MKVIIKTEKLSRSFRVGNQTIEALKNISIDIPEGSFTILKGRSGSGKTTLINLLGAIDSPTAGEIMIEDKLISKLTEEDKNNLRKSSFGFVFQSGALIPNMTVFENVELLLRFARVPLKERIRRVEECISYVGLSKKLKQYPEELSGGELQRASIARAIVNKPKVIFADEPTSSLDYANSVKIARLFKDISQKQGSTVVMATHDIKLLPVADCVFNLKDGEIVDE